MISPLCFEARLALPCSSAGFKVKVDNVWPFLGCFVFLFVFVFSSLAWIRVATSESLWISKLSSVFQKPFEQCSNKNRFTCFCYFYRQAVNVVTEAEHVHWWRRIKSCVTLQMESFTYSCPNDIKLYFSDVAVCFDWSAPIKTCLMGSFLL